MGERSTPPTVITFRHFTQLNFESLWHAGGAVLLGD